ncbi:MAG: hypothetical protein RMI94_05860 [Bryobacterales bacterium]|nr:hypothetical protein [Bryobacterales bacterium]
MKRPGRPPNPIPEDLARARLRKERALARYREMQNRRLAGRLLEAEAVEKRWAQGLAAIRDRILSIPDRLAAQLVGRDEHGVRELLRRELEEALRTAHAEA